MDCLFCKIVNGEIPSEKVYEDDEVYAFKDISPTADTHILVIPKIHIKSANEISSENANLLGDLFLAIKKIAKSTGISENGYRIVNNCGKNGGQTVDHLHFHVIGGEAMGWPPFPKN